MNDHVEVVRAALETKNLVSILIKLMKKLNQVNGKTGFMTENIVLKHEN